jgi:hypothetical protein
MTLNTLDILVRNEQWRKQILLIQGYVPRKSLQTGNYSHAPQVIQHDIDYDTDDDGNDRDDTDDNDSDDK